MIICAVCHLPITPDQFRLKIWNTTPEGDPQEREFVHAHHLKG